MPNLNVKEPEGFRELPATPKPARPQRKSGGMSPVVILVGVVVIVGIGVVLLNMVGIIHLWGEEPAQTTQSLPPPLPEEQAAVVDTASVLPPKIEQPAVVKKQEPAPTKRITPEGSGSYAYQVSSWKSMSKAEMEAEELKTAGFNAFVDEVTEDGVSWYRVRVGYYSTAAEAKKAAEEYALNWESGFYVTKVKK